MVVFTGGKGFVHFCINLKTIEHPQVTSGLTSNEKASDVVKHNRSQSRMGPVHTVAPNENRGISMNLLCS